MPIALVIGVIVASLAWILAAGLTANYGLQRGYGWWPGFLCSLVLGFAVVLLVITVAAGPRDVR